MFSRCYFVIFIAVLATLFSFSHSQESDHQPLTEANETVLISFVVENSEKIFTIATAEDDSYIVYRFGKPDNIEIEYPAKTEDSWDEFTFNHHSRAVGDAHALLDIQFLDFTIGDLRYIVHDSFSEEFIKSFIGATVINESAGTQTNLEAASQEKLGNLSQLRLKSKKIKSQSAFLTKVPSVAGKTSELTRFLQSSVALVALEQDLNTANTDIANYIAVAGQTLNRVEGAFDQLRFDTINPQTNIAYWTIENEAALENVRSQVQRILSNEQAVQQLVTQFENANALESKDQYLKDISAYSESMKVLNEELELLETTAITSFDESRDVYIRNFQNNSNDDDTNAQGST